MPQPETRHSLIVRLGRRNDESAWRDFVSAYEPFLKQLVSRQGVPQRHLQDVSQMLLLAIARCVEQWESDGRPASFRRWVATVSRNIVIRYMQREKRQISGDGGSDFLSQLQSIEAPPDRQEIQRYEYELIVWAADRVRSEFLPSSWEAFQRTVIGNESVAKAAVDLGVTPGSIYMSRSRIMARIKAIVCDLMDDEPALKPE